MLTAGRHDPPAKAWIAAIHHFLFLSDPRTERIIGEPKATNDAVIKLSVAVEMNLNTVRSLTSARRNARIGLMRMSRRPCTDLRLPVQAERDDVAPARAVLQVQPPGVRGGPGYARSGRAEEDVARRRKCDELAHRGDGGRAYLPTLLSFGPVGNAGDMGICAH